MAYASVMPCQPVPASESDYVGKRIRWWGCKMPAQKRLCLCQPRHYDGPAGRNAADAIFLALGDMIVSIAIRTESALIRELSRDRALAAYCISA